MNSKVSILTLAILAIHAVPSSSQTTFRGELIWPANVALPEATDESDEKSKGVRSWAVDPKSRGIKGIVVYISQFSGDGKMPVLDSKSARLKYEQEFKQLNGTAFSNLETHLSPKQKLHFPGYAIILNDQGFGNSTNAVTSGQPLVFVNKGQKRHLLHIASREKQAWCEIAASAIVVFEYKIDGHPMGRPVKIADSLHGWIQTWLFVFDHLYYAVTDTEGKFEIKIPTEEESFVWNICFQKSSFDPSTGIESKRRVGRKEDIRSRKMIDAGRLSIYVKP